MIVGNHTLSWPAYSEAKSKRWLLRPDCQRNILPIAKKESLIYIAKGIHRLLRQLGNRSICIRETKG